MRQSKLEQFLNGQEWSAKYARLSLPVLVRLVEQQRGKPDHEIPEFTYIDLARAVGQPRHAHPIHEALGTLGHALHELEEEQLPLLGKIPPIELIVWSKGKGSPGDDGFAFIGIFRKDLEGMSPALRRSTAGHIRSQILEYPYWRKILAELGLKPLTLDLPSVEAVISSPNADGFGGGESSEHRRLKLYLGAHYEELGIKGKFKPSFELALLSGDKADLMLDEVSGTRRYCIEVKSRISNEADLIRGVFQCVKYQAVLLAHERYEAAKSVNYTSKSIGVVLATERKLPEALKQLSTLLNVKVVTVNVPDN
jgi:hypothetical protein